MMASQRFTSSQAVKFMFVIKIFFSINIFPFRIKKLIFEHFSLHFLQQVSYNIQLKIFLNRSTLERKRLTLVLVEWEGVASPKIFSCFFFAFLLRHSELFPPWPLLLYDLSSYWKEKSFLFCVNIYLLFLAKYFQRFLTKNIHQISSNSWRV